LEKNVIVLADIILRHAEEEHATLLECRATADMLMMKDGDIRSCLNHFCDCNLSEMKFDSTH
jgi:hypothetical protein